MIALLVVAAVLVEKVARAICRKITGLGADWREYVLAAQIAVFGAENVDVDASNHARGVIECPDYAGPVVSSPPVSPVDGLDLDAIEAAIGPGPFVPGSMFGDLAALVAEVKRLRARDEVHRIEGNGLRGQVEAAEAAVERVRELHRNDGEGWCAEDGFGWPCVTARALDGAS